MSLFSHDFSLFSNDFFHPSLIPFFLKFASGKSDAEKKEMIKKVETQLVTFNGKDKLTVDEYYSVLKVQVNMY